MAAPTGEAMSPAARRQFVRDHRTAVFGYARRRDGPAMTIVYYVMDGDDILVSTMAARAKANAVRRNPLVSLCIHDEQWPPGDLLVYCRARIETDAEAAVDLGMRIAGLMAGKPTPEEVRPVIAEGCRREERVVLRLTPYATFCTPPRHVYRPDDVPGLRHELGATVPWEAE